MKRSDIHRAYDRIRPDQETKMRMLENILTAASEVSPAGKEIRMKRTNWKKTLLIAAMISIMVFLMGCAVVVFTLQDLKIGEYRIHRGDILDSEGNIVKEFYTVKDVISLQGIKNSPSQMAAQEWHEFESNYDKDNKLLDEADRNPMEVSHDYDAYFVYTQEMVDKIDEIAAKYDLKLAGEFAGVQRENPDIIYDSLGISGLIKPDAKAVLEFAGGYFYACGNFNADFSLTLTEEERAWDREISGSVRYCGKEYLDTVFAHISEVDDFEQWTYKLSDGKEVLIVTGDEAARILCDTEEAFISVWLKTVYCDENNVVSCLSKRDVEKIADAMDFTIIPQKPDMKEAQRRIDEAFVEWKAEQAALMETNDDPFAPKDSYAEKIQSVMDNGVDPNQFYYALYDVNGDGIEDLFLGGEQESFGAVYTMHNGVTYMLLSFGMDRYSYLCENGVVLHLDPVAGPHSYYYYRIGEVTGDGTEAKCVDAIRYNPQEKTWVRSVNGYYGDEERITEQEAMDIIEDYGRIDLEMKPISEFTKD